jgi:diacylglycerol kinase
MFNRTIFQSFRLACEGLLFIVKTERNMKIHLIFAFMAVVVSLALKVDEIEWIFISFAIALVLITEAANTAFELLLDFLHGDAYHPNVKILKDIAAGGVFVAALNALIIGLIIFTPKIYFFVVAFINR